MARILALSFDGTIVENDLHKQIYAEFAPEEFASGEEALALGSLSIEEFHARMMSAVEAGGDEILSFALRVAVPRVGLVDLVNWAEGNDWVVTVLASGLDFVVEGVLDDFGLAHVVKHAGRARKHYRWQIRHLSPRGIELAAGFQLSYVRAFQSAGDVVAFCGSSAADHEAAAAADAVFAREELALALRSVPVPVYPFETFFDIREAMKEHASSWSTAARDVPGP